MKESSRLFTNTRLLTRTGLVTATSSVASTSSVTSTSSVASTSTVTSTRILIWILNLIIILPAILSSSSLVAQEADALVTRIREKLNVVKDYQAQGILVTNVSFMKVPKSEITVYYKNPDKFKIKKKDGISIVPKGGMSINVNSLFAGNGKFTAVPAGKTKFQGEELSVIKLLPLDENSDVVVSTLYVDDKHALVRKAITTTKESGTYEIEMNYGKFTSWGLPDKVVFLFNTQNYKLPKGLAFDYDTGEKPVVNDKSENQKGKIEINYSSYIINKGIAQETFK
jgi:outer membrane lipoprotein-sorting protein